MDPPGTDHAEEQKQKLWHTVGTQLLSTGWGKKSNIFWLLEKQEAAVGSPRPLPWPPYLAKHRGCQDRALPLTGKQKVKHPRGAYSDWWSVCYSSFVPTAALRFTLSKAHTFWRRDGTFKSSEGRWNRFGRSGGRHTVGVLRTWVLGGIE